MSLSRNEPAEAAANVRARCSGERRVRLVARDAVFEADGGASRPLHGESPAPLDLLLGALATELLAGFRREAARDGLALDDAELTLSAWLENPLVALGVVGESGSARIASIRGSLYASSTGEPSALAAALARASASGPIHSTLCRVADVGIELKPTI
jgi:hypothetical protein